jgi:hypothetical protein
VIRRFLKRAFLALVLGSLVLLLASYYPPPRIAVGEIYHPDEHLHVSDLNAAGNDLVHATRQKVGDGVYRRDAHAKTHACVAATYEVLRTNDLRLRRGLFNEPRSYKAWIRYSNADPGVNNDWFPDARGMAIKVLGVDGDKLLEDEHHEKTQDFVMINNPVFVVGDVEDYALLTRSLSQGKQNSFYFPGINPFEWRLRALRLTLGILKFPSNLLATRFFSVAAYRFGAGDYVKYSARPVACTAGGSVPSRWPGFGASALHDSLKSRLASGNKASYCYDFMVQFQRQDKYMPVEDPTIEWDESDSPFIPVARVRIDPQDIQPALTSGFCENLSITPWHSLPEHEPVGALNRLRRAVYQSSARFRRCKNGRAFGEPLDDGSMAFNSEPCNAHQPVPKVTGKQEPAPPKSAKK